MFSKDGIIKLASVGLFSARECRAPLASLVIMRERVKGEFGDSKPRLKTELHKVPNEPDSFERMLAYRKKEGE